MGRTSLHLSLFQQIDAFLGRNRKAHPLLRVISRPCADTFCNTRLRYVAYLINQASADRETDLRQRGQIPQNRSDCPNCPHFGPHPPQNRIGYPQPTDSTCPFPNAMDVTKPPLRPASHSLVPPGKCSRSPMVKQREALACAEWPRLAQERPLGRDGANGELPSGQFSLQLCAREGAPSSAGQACDSASQRRSV